MRSAVHDHQSPQSRNIYGGTKLVFKPVGQDSSEINHCLLLISFVKKLVETSHHLRSAVYDHCLCSVRDIIVAEDTAAPLNTKMFANFNHMFEPIHTVAPILCTGGTLPVAPQGEEVLTSCEF